MFTMRKNHFKQALWRIVSGLLQVFQNGGKIHDIPAAGTIAYDNRGKNHMSSICGKSFVRLGSHVRESHGMTIDEYKERFWIAS